MSTPRDFDTWVPADKFLPMGPHDVLVTDMEGIWIGSYFTNMEGIWSWCDIDGHPFDSVITHWRELPELPVGC